MFSKKLYGFAIPLLFVLTGCFTSTIPIPELPPDQILVGAEKQSVLQQIAASSEEIRSFRSLAQLEASKSVGSEQLKQVVVFVRPDKLRVEFFEPTLAQLLVLIVLRDGIIRGIDKNERRAFVGTGNRENVAKLLSVPLEPEAAMLWFVGRFSPPLEDSADSLTLYRISDDSFLLVIRDLGGRDSYVQFKQVSAPGTMIVERLVVVRHDAGDVLLEAKYYYPAAIQSPVVPSRIEVELPEQSTKAVLTYESPVVNPQNVREQLFSLPALDGLTITDLDARSLN